MGNDNYIRVSVAAQRKYLNKSVRHVARMCETGIFKTARKTGTQGKTSCWEILKSEVLSHIFNGHSQPQY